MNWVAIGILVAYFVVAIVMGIILGKRDEKKSSSEYFVASGGLTVAMIVPLLFGEMIAGAGTVGNAGDAFSGGLSSVWAQWGMSLGCFIFAAGMLKYFYALGQRGVMTVAEGFLVRFDKKCRTVMMVITVVVYLIIFATQPVAAAGILGPLFGVNTTIMTWIMSIMFILFAITGGLKGLARMNTLHAIAMYVGMGVVAAFAITAANGFGNMAEVLPATHFNVFTYPSVMTVIAWGLGAGLSFLTASTIVRVTLSAKSEKTARKGIIISAIVVLPFALLPAFVGMAARVVMPDIIPSQALFTMANSISPVLGGLASMAVIAAIFSTAPSLLLIIGTTLTRDMYVHARPEATDKQQIRFCSIVTAVLAIVCTILGMNISSILGQILGAFQIRTITGITLLIAVNWKRVNSTSAFCAMIVGGVLAAYWHFAGSPFGIAPFWPSAVIGTLLLVVMTLITGKDKESAGHLQSQKVLSGELAVTDLMKK